MLTGSIVALVTPFHSDGNIHYEKLGELIEYHIENQTDGLLLLGTTGEFAMNKLGFEAGPCRLPLDELSLNHRETLTKSLKGVSK